PKGRLIIEPRTPNASIGIAGGTGTLNLSSTRLDFIKDGFSEIIIGHENGSGLINVGSYTAFKDNLTLRTPTGNGDIVLAGALATGSDDAAGSITLQAGRHVLLNNGSSITTQGRDIVLNSDRDGIDRGSIQLTGATLSSNG